MKVALIVLKFLVIAALFIISNNNLYLSNSQDRETFFDSYYLWFDGIFENMKTMTGYVVNSEWLPSKGNPGFFGSGE